MSFIAYAVAYLVAALVLAACMGINHLDED